MVCGQADRKAVKLHAQVWLGGQTTPDGVEQQIKFAVLRQQGLAFFGQITAQFNAG